VRFEDEKGEVQLGQPTDSSIDAGLAFAEGREIEVNVIDGDVYTGTVTDRKAVIKKVLPALSNLTSKDPNLPGVSASSAYQP